MTKIVGAVTGLAIAWGTAAGAQGQAFLLAESRQEATGANLWQEIQGYRKWWTVWPGTKHMHRGKRGHGPFLTTYQDLRGRRTLWYGKETALPGTTLLVEEYDADRRLMSISVMHKVEKYNPEAGDWFWVRYEPDGRVRAEGKLQACIECHARKAGNDYVFTAPLGK